MIAIVAYLKILVVAVGAAKIVVVAIVAAAVAVAVVRTVGRSHWSCKSHRHRHLQHCQ